MGMSSTVQEITPLVDSSEFECIKDQEKSSTPAASPRGKLKEEASNSGADDQLNSYDGVGTSNKMKRAELSNTRYFIIKSLNHQNIQLSIKKGIWATQVMNEPILEEAFLNSSKVILIFSVNMSGFFQGYAQMISSVGWRRDNIWSQGSGKNNPWGRSFKVKWLCLHDLPFQSTLHLKNPWNDYKPVKISRDCQELPQDIAEALCDLLDQGNTMVARLKRDETSGDDFPRRRRYVEPFHSKQDEDFNMNLVHMAPMLYPPLLYQPQSEASGFHLQQWRSCLPDKSSIFNGTTNVKQLKHCQINGSATSNLNNSSRIDSWGLSADWSPLDGSLTEDAILEMSYEEYLEAHSQSSRKFHHSVGGPSASFPKSSSSKERSDESQTASTSKKRTYRQALE
ncbi:YTH domain-containing protein 1 [Dorcoceras hygrometricum]|uniref:YTH domain-containing family protein n=1 Tax=Dorcoceras hygrometricum TaxID=472368 RepID=A0A2Z7CHE7_9LAMI|nr:YTH domain-containing protein 1 [Dorcoceras hygrometricum]